MTPRARRLPRVLKGSSNTIVDALTDGQAAARLRELVPAAWGGLEERRGAVGDVPEAVARLRKEGFAVGEMTYSAAIGRCGAAGTARGLEAAVGLYRAATIEDGVEESYFLATPLLSAAAQVGDDAYKAAVALVKRSAQTGVPQDVTDHRADRAAVAKLRGGKKKEKKKAPWDSNAPGFPTSSRESFGYTLELKRVLEREERAGGSRWAAARAVLQQVDRDRGVLPGIVTMNAMMLCTEAPEHIDWVFVKCREFDVTPDTHLFGAAVRMCGKFNPPAFDRATELFVECVRNPHTPPDLYLYNMYLRTAGVSGERENMEAIFATICAHPVIEPDTVTAVTLATRHPAPLEAVPLVESVAHLLDERGRRDWAATLTRARARKAREAARIPVWYQKKHEQEAVRKAPARPRERAPPPSPARGERRTRAARPPPDAQKAVSVDAASLLGVVTAATKDG